MADPRLLCHTGCYGTTFLTAVFGHPIVRAAVLSCDPHFHDDASTDPAVAELLRSQKVMVLLQQNAKWMQLNVGPSRLPDSTSSNASIDAQQHIDTLIHQLDFITDKQLLDKTLPRTHHDLHEFVLKLFNSTSPVCPQFTELFTFTYRVITENRTNGSKPVPPVITNEFVLTLDACTATSPAEQLIRVLSPQGFTTPVNGAQQRSGIITPSLHLLVLVQRVHPVAPPTRSSSRIKPNPTRVRKSTKSHPMPLLAQTSDGLYELANVHRHTGSPFAGHYDVASTTLHHSDDLLKRRKEMTPKQFLKFRNAGTMYEYKLCPHYLSSLPFLATFHHGPHLGPLMACLL
jgi:hypothetical protein